MSDTVIKVRGAGKKFAKSLRRSMWYGAADVLRSAVGREPDGSLLRRDEFWAVHDISFELKRGDSFGIIGPNGSGKTTILKLLNGIFMPDKGRIEVRGRMGGLIQIGAGFHPMLSGRENIYVNGTILGMTRKEIDRKFDEIVAFADIGDFLDAPVKHYSSGMYVRLGFAVAAHSDPDILLVDEVLAVGDADFQLKCYQKMHAIRKRGTTLVHVAHNEYTIREQTERCLYLRQGREQFTGSSEEAITRYLHDVYAQKALRSAHQESDPGAGADGGKKVELRVLQFTDAGGRNVESIASGDPLTLMVDVSVREPISHPIVGVNFYRGGELVCGFNSDYEGVPLDGLTGEARVIIEIPQCFLPAGNYQCSVIVADEHVTNLLDYHDMRYTFVVDRAPRARGALRLPTQWRCTKLHI